MRDIARVAVRLLICTLMSGAVLSVVSALTEENIRALEQAAELKSRLETFPEADDFERIELEPGAPVKAAYYALSGGKTLGIVVETAAKGFNGDIALTIGIDTQNGSIAAVRVGSHAETPGLGDKASEPDFYEQFTGKQLAPISLTKLPPGEQQIQAITAATITSKGITEAVNDAVAFARELSGR